MFVFWLISIWTVQEKRYFTFLPYKITGQRLPELYNTESKDFKKKKHQKIWEFWLKKAIWQQH